MLAFNHTWNYFFPKEFWKRAESVQPGQDQQQKEKKKLEKCYLKLVFSLAVDKKQCPQSLLHHFGLFSDHSLWEAPASGACPHHSFLLMSLGHPGHPGITCTWNEKLTGCAPCLEPHLPEATTGNARTMETPTLTLLLRFKVAALPPVQHP